MSATTATTGAPDWSRRVWADSTHIYLEIPSRSGPPLIQKYAKTEGGLSKALELICLAFKKDQPLGGSYQIPMNPLIKRKTGINDFSPEQRKRAGDILRKLKII